MTKYEKLNQITSGFLADGTTFVCTEDSNWCCF